MMLIRSPEQQSLTDSYCFCSGNNSEAISVIITIADCIPSEQPNPPTIPIIICSLKFSKNFYPENISHNTKAKHIVTPDSPIRILGF